MSVGGCAQDVRAQAAVHAWTHIIIHTTLCFCTKPPYLFVADTTSHHVYTVSVGDEVLVIRYSTLGHQHFVHTCRRLEVFSLESSPETVLC